MSTQQSPELVEVEAEKFCKIGEKNWLIMLLLGDLGKPSCKSCYQLLSSVALKETKANHLIPISFNRVSPTDGKLLS